MGPLDILLAIVGISVLVVVHEGGHYLAARAFKMRVLRFSIGLGPALWRYKPKDSPTTFQICAIPFLAYVQIDGMNPTDQVDPKDPTLYPNKSVLARIFTIFAGPFANYLAASLLIFGLTLTGGVPHRVAVGEVLADKPAASAGLRVGDVIVEANGRAIVTADDLIEATSNRAGMATVYVIERDGRRLAPITITPVDSEGRGIIGVATRQLLRDASVADASLLAVVLPWRVTVATFEAIGELIKRRTTEGVTGPIGMGKAMAESVQQGPRAYLGRLMFLSVALGLFNLLPFPALDGGRLVFLGYELVTRRRANEKIEAVIHTVGLLFLLGVIILVTIRDVLS